MKQIFLQKFANKSRDELHHIINNSADYQPIAVDAAIELLKRQGDTSETIEEIERAQEQKKRIISEVAESKLTVDIDTLFPRVGAFIIDGLIVIGVGFFLGLILSEYFVKLQHHGVWVGFIVTTIYLTLGNSILMDGKTFGKQFLSLQTVGIDGSVLLVSRAFFRTLILTAPFFLFNYLSAMSWIPDWLSTLMGNVLGILVIAFVYFYLVNQNSRQTVHDLICKTLVVSDTQNLEKIQSGVARKKVYILAGIIFFIIGTLLLTLNRSTDSSGEYANLTAVLEANQEVFSEILTELDEFDETLSARIKILTNSEVGLIVTVYTNQKIASFKSDYFNDRVFAIISSKEYNINRIDYLKVIVKYQYDIGIAKYENMKSWRTELRLKQREP